MESNKIIKERRKAVAAIIRSNREKLNISQEKLANMTGCSRLTIHRIENCVFSPNADQLYLILNALDVNFELNGEKI